MLFFLITSCFQNWIQTQHGLYWYIHLGKMLTLKIFNMVFLKKKLKNWFCNNIQPLYICQYSFVNPNTLASLFIIVDILIISKIDYCFQYLLYFIQILGIKPFLHLLDLFLVAKLLYNSKDSSYLRLKVFRGKCDFLNCYIK